MFHIDINNTEKLNSEQLTHLNDMWKRCAKRIILSTTLAGSGHPGGSLSSLHTLLLAYSVMQHDPSNPKWDKRDRFLASIGHISPAIYSVLCEFNYIKEDDFLLEFRRAGSAFAGHIEQTVPGVELNTGNLGQGLSAACGIALATDRRGLDAKTLVIMGDGEQQKGQIAEARRFASKFQQSNLIALIDRNHLQIGGVTEEVMPVRVREEYQAAGWNTIYVANGHDFNQLYSALRQVWLGENLVTNRPTAIIIRSVMGKGIDFMENKAKYHGSPLKPDAARDALRQLGFNPEELDEWQKKREAHTPVPASEPEPSIFPDINPGDAILYEKDTVTDCRSAYGNALKSLAEVNNLPNNPVKIFGFSCDLEGSVKMQGFHKVSPNAFIECGIQEHHAATCAGTSTKEGIVSFFSTFGVFAVAETYNQHRLNDLNYTNLKIVATHVGLDVGEDGPTHQCIDYLALLNNLFGFSIFMPADPNQTDRIIRYVASHKGNHFVGMGRSKMSVITKEDGTPFFDTDYHFIPGKADTIRTGTDLTLIAYGPMTTQAVMAHDLLKKQGISCTVLNMASLKPVDTDAIIKAAKTTPIITIEDHIASTGLGAVVSQILISHQVSQKVLALGITQYGSSGKPIDLYRQQGLDGNSIAEQAIKFIK